MTGLVAQTTSAARNDAPIMLSELEAAERGRLITASVLSCLSALLWIPQAGLIAWAIEALAFEPAVASERVWRAAVGFLLIAAMRAALSGVSGRLAHGAAVRIVSMARDALLDSLSRAAPLDAGRLPSGAAASLGAEKLDTLIPYLTRYQPARWRAAIVPLALALAVAFVSWAAALVLLIAGPLIPVFMALVGLAAKEASERQMVEIGAMNALMLDRLRGLEDIRLLDAVDRVAADFTAAAKSVREKTMAVLRVAFLSSAVLELFSALGVAMVAVYVGFALLGVLEFGAGTTPLTLAEGVFALMLAPEFFQPLRDFAAAWHDRAAAKAAAAEFDAATASPGPRMLGSGAAVPPLGGAPLIRLSARQPCGARLSGPQLIRPGETVALVGPSGVGKSSILAAIAGLSPIEPGSVEVAGRPLDDACADAWRARLAWIAQRPYFIAGSVRANVALAGDPGDPAAVRAALSLAAAEQIPARIAGGLDARLGETGYGVSGGEARRLAVARAALAGRDVILADEPTADLDPETAAMVTEGLLRLARGNGAQGATLIVATHDQSLAARLDRVIAVRAEPGGETA